MIKRWASYLALAMCACFVSFPASAVERTVSYLAQTFDHVGEFHGAAMTRLELGLASWRTGGENTSDLKSNLRAESNHFVQVSATPVGVPDWDLRVNS
jgi:hypothetical protein